MCIMCGNFYHTNKIVSKYNSGYPVKFIDNTLIICQDHPNVALTSNLPYDELSSEAKQLISQIKLTTREQIKQEIISEINLEKQNNNQKGHNDTVYKDSLSLPFSHSLSLSASLFHPCLCRPLFLSPPLSLSTSVKLSTKNFNESLNIFIKQ